MYITSDLQDQGQTGQRFGAEIHATLFENFCCPGPRRDVVGATPRSISDPELAE